MAYFEHHRSFACMCDLSSGHRNVSAKVLQFKHLIPCLFHLRSEVTGIPQFTVLHLELQVLRRWQFESNVW